MKSATLNSAPLERQLVTHGYYIGITGKICVSSWMPHIRISANLCLHIAIYGLGRSCENVEPVINSRKAVKKVERTAIEEKNILIVDDDEDLLDLQRIILIHQHYTVFTANCGTAALEQFKHKKDEIDLVILDIQMPDISGREVYNQIKSLRPDIKVLISSGYDKNTALEGITLDPGDSFIQKPSSRAAFVHNVRQILEK